MQPPQDGRFDSLLAVAFSLCPKQHNRLGLTDAALERRDYVRPRPLGWRSGSEVMHGSMLRSASHWTTAPGTTRLGQIYCTLVWFAEANTKVWRRRATKNAPAKRSRLSDIGIGFGPRGGTVSRASHRYEGVVDTFVR